MKLTDMAIKKAKPREKVYSLGDGNGLSLIVEPNGSKGWRFRYQFNGKSKMISLGIYPVITLNEAREKRDNARKLVANGTDPSEARKEERDRDSGKSDNTFKKITLEWFNGRKDRWSEGYRDDMMEAFENDVFPYIGDRPIAEIKPLELLEALSIMEKRGVTEKLKKVRQRCGEVWKYAIITGRAEYNPAPDLASAFIPHQRENYPYLLADELPEFLSSVDKYQGSQIVRTALNILMLTGLRPGELRKSEWSFIDFESKTWKLPEKIMKMGRVHVVPMSDQVISLLRQIQPISGDYQYIFPSRTNHKMHLSEAGINGMIGRIGYRGRVTGHGFRHTMSTILHEKGFNTAWIELQLAHVDKNSIRGTYNHALYLEGRSEMMQWYADYIDELRSKKK
ncbi:tyrosine-type recombinase/integrase [Proteus terrae]|uniref:tyrosine-type recombinase/integrase n=1 Tax=Proteus terrae TaxID=1574161 RepID=UPI000D692699|nr:integrase arm-type DNA-binding domain-containing protein [Proteus terrae]